MQAVTATSYEANYRAVTSAQTPQELMELNVRVQRLRGKAPLLPNLFASLVKARQAAQTFTAKRNDFVKNDGPQGFVTQLIRHLGAVSALEGSVSMLLTLAESDEVIDEVGQLKIRLQSVS